MSGKSGSAVTKLARPVFHGAPDFYGLMNEQCDALVEAMEAVLAYLEDGGEEKAEVIRRIEKRGDELKARNVNILNHAFDTPIDRDYICRAIVTLNMAINVANTKGWDMELLEIQPDKFMLEIAAEYRSGAQSLQKGFRKLATRPDQAKEDARLAYNVEQNIENIYRRALDALSEVDGRAEQPQTSESDSKSQDILTVMDSLNRGEVYHHMSRSAYRLAWAADRLHDIAVEMS